MTDIEDRVDRAADLVLSNADRVGPDARKNLKPLLRHYAKMAHPFRACVRDNRKRFGPKAEAVCAVLKDIIRGTTHWRGKTNPNDHGVAPGILAAEDTPVIDEDTADLLLSLTDDDLDRLCAILDGTA